MTLVPPERNPNDRLPGGMRQCVANSVRTKERCKAPAMRGLDKCLRHSGLSLADARRRSKEQLVALQDPYIQRLRQIAADPYATNVEIIAAAKLIFDKSLVSDETDTRIEADKVRIMAIALGRALNSLQMTDEQKERAAIVLFNEMKALTSGAAPKQGPG